MPKKKQLRTTITFYRIMEKADEAIWVYTAYTASGKWPFPRGQITPLVWEALRPFEDDAERSIIRVVRVPRGRDVEYIITDWDLSDTALCTRCGRGCCSLSHPTPETREDNQNPVCHECSASMRVERRARLRAQRKS